MATYSCLSKLNIKVLLEYTAVRCYSKFIVNPERFRNVHLNLNHTAKVPHVQSRFLRGASRTYEPRNKDENDENPVQNDKVEYEHVAKGIRKRQIKDLMDNSVTKPNSAQVDSEVLDSWSAKTYPKEYYKKVESPRVNPSETTVMLFPGQGSQFVGMGNRLLKYPNVERMYSIASEILGYDLLDICLNGPKDKLDKTVNCQPAVVVTSLAAVEKLKDESPHVIDSCVAAAGFSVGEITALIFAGMLTFEDGIKLTRIRAEAMQAASEMEAGGMMSVFYGADARIGFACNAAVEWCERRGLEDPQCIVANHLFSGCKVIAGNNEALEFIQKNAKDFGIRKYKQLRVSGAFHTKLMLPAEESVKIALMSLKFKDPAISLYSNVEGKIYSNTKQIIRLLPKQISSPVKWEQVMHSIYKRPAEVGFPRTFECGPGKSLNAILEKVNGKAWEFMTSVES
ncbi:hypothetical protein CHUAL_007290 [Chamberlinius hualienensis]